MSLAPCLFLLATLLTTCMSAIIHHITQEVPVGQVIFFRSALALPVIVAYMALRGQFPAALRTRRPRLHIIRGLLGAAAMGCSFLSLAYLPVASAKAIGYLSPLITLGLAGVVGGERVNRRLLWAATLGFCGIGFMLWQAMSLPETGALLGVCSGLAFAVLVAFSRIHVRRMTATERPATIALSFAVVSALVGLATLPLGWAAVDWKLVCWLVLTGLFGGIAHVIATEAMRLSPVSQLAPLEYSGLVWALLIDFAIFQARPGVAGLTGTALILAAALLASLRPFRGAKASDTE